MICLPSSAVVVAPISALVPLSLPAPVSGAIPSSLTVDAIKLVPFFGSITVAFPLVLFLFLFSVLVVVALVSLIASVLGIMRFDQVSVKNKLVDVVEIRNLGLLGLHRR